MKIGFLCGGNPHDKNTWSGTTHKMFQCIEKLGHEVVWIPATKYTAREERFIECTARLHERLLNRTYNRYQNLSRACLASHRLQRKLAAVKPDLLFAVGTINELAFLQTDIPTVYINDILYDQHINYYPAYMGLGAYSKKMLRYLERKALRKCAAVILPSEWSIDRAQQFYQIPEEKLHLLRFGPNIEVPAQLPVRPLSQEKFIFLFLGVEWERKGGDIALQTVEILKERGFAVQLKVVGCVPPVASELMKVIPFLSKNDPQDYQTLRGILSEADFLLLPTRAECYGIVFCEASAYGLPSITTDTGGVTSIVKEGVNGYALPPDATARAYSDTIEPLLRDPERLQQLSESSRKRYEGALTWKFWEQQLDEILSKNQQ